MTTTQHACATPQAVETLGRDARECNLDELARVLGGPLGMGAFGQPVVMRNADGETIGYRFLDSDGTHGLQIWLDWDDTFTVERLSDGHVLGFLDDIYVDQLPEIAWQASCFRDTPFGTHDPTRNDEVTR